MNKKYKEYGFQPVLDNSMNIYSPDEAFYVGTIFKTLDEPYKNLRISNLSNVDDRERLMAEVQKYGIVVNDLDLYLDLYPNDINALRLRKKYWEIYSTLTEKYNEMYSPISKSSPAVNVNPFPWSTTEFPWGDK